MNLELTGLEFLRKKEIKNMKCDMDKPYAFISYSHDEHDSQIVMNVFKRLMDKGYNLWIDVANMPANQYSWEESAVDALTNENCSFAFFFRSEHSMIKATIAEEIDMIERLEIRIVPVDIWCESGMNAGNFLTYLLREVRQSGQDKTKNEELKNCRNICKNVKTECKAVRLAGDAENDIIKLVDEIIEEMPENSGIRSVATPAPKPEPAPVASAPKSEPAPVVSTPKPDPAPAVSSPVESAPEKDNKEHVYTIFGKEYRDTVQGQLMYNAYAALIARHPECAEQLTRNTSVARAEHVTNADTKDAHPSYFRKCRSFHVNGVEYLVGIAYGFDAKLVQIRDMFETCGEDPAQFVLNGEPLTPKQGRGRKAKELTADAASKSPSADDFVYTIFGKEYRDSVQGQMMYDAYEALIARHPECAERLTQITSVARAENVTNINTTQARPPYFRRCKSFHVNGIEYLVGIAYGFNDKIKQIKGMFKICGEDPEQFAVKSMPELSKRGGGDAAKESSGSPKQGLGELIE